MWISSHNMALGDTGRILSVMKKLGEIVRYAREQKGWTIQRLAEELGIGVSAMAKKERGELRIKPDEKQAIAELLDLTTADLDKMTLGLPLGKPSRGQPDDKGIPVLNRASAGYAIDYTVEAASGTDLYHGANQYLPRGDINNDLAFALIVQGDSMEPHLHHGDYAIFLPAQPGKIEPRPGDCVCVYFSEGSARRGACIALYSQVGDNVVLIKTNRKYQPINVSNSDIGRMGVFVEKRSKQF